MLTLEGRESRESATGYLRVKKALWLPMNQSPVDLVPILHPIPRSFSYPILFFLTILCRSTARPKQGMGDERSYFPVPDTAG